MKPFRFPISSTRHQRGIALPVLAAVAVILILIGIAAWYLIFRDDKPELALQPQASSQQTAAAQREAPPPPANVGQMSVPELLEEARKAMAQQRLVGPAGNNAFEFYLKALEKEPGNQVAEDALRETFPFAAKVTEQEINAGNFAEAERQIGVLTKADEGNFTLTMLRSKLDAQRELAARAEEQQLLAEQEALRLQQAQVLAAEQAAAEAASAQAAAEAAAARQAATAVATAEPEPEAEPEPVATTQPVGPTRGPQLVRRVGAEYPPVAARRRQEGWVDVAFTVDATGKVVDAQVVDTERGDAFNRAALAAVSRYEFEPALRNGQPVSSARITQRVVFSLSQ